MTRKPTRPIVRYHGGKWRLAPWIIGHFPSHRIYTEAYGGGASVLLRKPRSYCEVYNDLDGEMVNVFRVLRNPSQSRELLRLIYLTPFSRDEFVASYIASDDPIEQARRTIARSFMGFGSAATNTDHSTGFRANSNRSGTTPAHDWQHYPEHLVDLIERLRGVVIENRDALDVIRAHDAPDALHYVDPPYPLSVRYLSRGHAHVSVYRHEMTDDQHIEMAATLHQCRGMVIVSGYQCPLYDDMFRDWHAVSRAAHADGARDRIETLWISPNSVTTPQLF